MRSRLTLADEARAGPLLLEALRSGRPEPLEEGLRRLDDALEAEGIPSFGQRLELFFELVHPSRADERAIHGLN